MITEAEKLASQVERIRILRDKYGDTHPEVQAWNKKPVTGKAASPTTGDRLTTEEVVDASETVPAPMGGKKPVDDFPSNLPPGPGKIAGKPVEE